MPPSLIGKLSHFRRNRTVIGKAIGEWCLRHVQLGVKVVRQPGENLSLAFLFDLSSHFCECSIHQRGIVCFRNARPCPRQQVTINSGRDPHTSHATKCSIVWESNCSLAA